MRLYRFSPIENQNELMQVIKFLHKKANELCFKILGNHLQVSENIGIFPHYDEELESLKKIQSSLTIDPDEFHTKYLILKEPIIIYESQGIPKGTYKYLYIRRTDPYRHHVGDVDFCLEQEEFDKFKSELLSGKKMKGMRYISKLDMIELFDPDFDVLVYLSPLMWEKRINIKRDK